jgi:hypothetical protein
MAVNDGGVPPILAQKHCSQPSAFTPENLLREARRQKRITDSRIPEICVLDPDGDIVRSLHARGEVRLEPGWACYHTQLYLFSRGGIEFGIVGCAVGASFAALYAFAGARQKHVLRFAHVTNQMGRVDGDFEKGEADGGRDALHVIAIVADRLCARFLP